MNENKTAMYLVAIVGIVAAVGILTLLLNANNGNSYVSESDLSGEAVSAMKTSGTLTGTKSLSTTSSSASLTCCRTSGGKCVCPPTGGSCADC